MSMTRDVLQTAFRLAPWPTEPGLRAVGKPDAWSPVLLTGNYDLTVRRVTRALRGIDAWLVVAPSSGINVWCAAAGGHLTTHHVVTALKTSGVAERVRHRRVILPQLAATGVVARDVARRCGWRARFGPVYAEDLPRYLTSGEEKSEAMRSVRFDTMQRLEMAAAWAAPAALVTGAIALVVQAAWTLPLMALACALALGVFLLYDRLPAPRRAVFLVGSLALAGTAAVAFGAAAAGVAAAAVATTLLCLGLTFDWAGSTPIEGGSLFEEGGWRIRLDEERCRGLYSCFAVCPEACFEKRAELRKIALAHGERCVRCGACVVQCGVDALAFEDEHGARIPPETIRRFKLNLLGRRDVAVGPLESG